jgi:hypothetical protein
LKASPTWTRVHRRWRAKERLAKAELARELSEIIAARRLTQMEAAAVDLFATGPKPASWFAPVRTNLFVPSSYPTTAAL